MVDQGTVKKAGKQAVKRKGKGKKKEKGREETEKAGAEKVDFAGAVLKVLERRKDKKAAGPSQKVIVDDMNHHTEHVHLSWKQPELSLVVMLR